MSDDGDPPSLMGLLERVAVRLAHEGADHPVAGATALAARGHEGVGPAEFAAAHGIPPEVVAASEAGGIPLNELPEPVLVAVVANPALDLAGIEALDRRMAVLSGSSVRGATVLPVLEPDDAVDDDGGS